MKVAVYSKSIFKNHPTKDMLTTGLKNLGHCVVEIDDFDCLKDFDRLLVFGGDGTMLHSACNSDCPIVGVNLGNVGFLTQFESSVTVAELSRAIENDKFDCKPLLKSIVNGTCQVALNDFVIKTTSSRPISLSVKVDGEYVDKYHADGLIVASPIGSTAYSLSAGGPIVSPDVDAIIINPICAHSLHSRPLIISGNSIVEVTIEGDNLMVIADGREQINLDNASTIQVSKSSKQARFVQNGNNTFYNKLLEKMNKWGTTI